MTVKTEIIAKIPMVIPSSERNVRSLFPLSEPKANEKLSRINLVISISKKCNLSKPEKLVAEF